MRFYEFINFWYFKKDTNVSLEIAISHKNNRQNHQKLPPGGFGSCQIFWNSQ